MKLSFCSQKLLYTLILVGPIAEKLLKFLEKEMSKKHPDKDVVSTYLDEEYPYRRAWIEQMEGNRVKGILKKYPCFSNFEHVSLLLLYQLNCVPIIIVRNVC